MQVRKIASLFVFIPERYRRTGDAPVHFTGRWGLSVARYRGLPFCAILAQWLQPYPRRRSSSTDSFSPHGSSNGRIQDTFLRLDIPCSRKTLSQTTCFRLGAWKPNPRILCFFSVFNMLNDAEISLVCRVQCVRWGGLRRLGQLATPVVIQGGFDWMPAGQTATLTSNESTI